MYFRQWNDALLGCFNELKCKIKGDDVAHEVCFNLAKKIMTEVKIQSKKIVIIGNGGSSAIASHISQDIINKLKTASTVLTDASLLTCIGNDFGYDHIFSRSLDVLLTENDLLIAISDSGESKNILNSIAVAKNKKCKIITLSAFNNTNSLFTFFSDIAFHVPTHNYGIAEVAHLTILHTLIDELAGIQLNNKANQ